MLVHRYLPYQSEDKHRNFNLLVSFPVCFGSPFIVSSGGGDLQAVFFLLDIMESISLEFLL